MLRKLYYRCIEIDRDLQRLLHAGSLLLCAAKTYKSAVFLTSLAESLSKLRNYCPPPGSHVYRGKQPPASPQPTLEKSRKKNTTR